MFYTILFQGRLVPRWLSVWGLVAIVPYAIPVFLGLFTDVDVDSMLFDLPLGIQEMILAVWLIVTGFAGNRAASQDGLEPDECCRALARQRSLVPVIPLSGNNMR